MLIGGEAGKNVFFFLCKIIYFRLQIQLKGNKLDKGCVINKKVGRI